MTRFADLSLPVPSSGNELFDVLDSTKLNRFLDCPRGFWIEYILGWRPISPNLHLAYGSCHHESMEVLMQTRDGVRKGYTGADVQAAFEAFERTWNKIYGNENDSILIVGADGDETVVEGNDAKNLDNAYTALIDYAKTFRDDSFRTLWTEVSGAIPVSEDQLVYYKCDSIIEDQGHIWSYEHKTTGRKTKAWADKWQIMLQIGTYLHVLYMHWGDDVAGIMINGTILRKPLKSGKSNNECTRIPVKLARDMMSQWLYEVNYVIQLLDYNMKELEKCSPSDPIMKAFPRNSESCSKFGCKHPYLCGRVANPLRICDEPPIGYKVEFWDPRRTTGDDEGTPVESMVEEEEKVIIIEEEGFSIKGIPGPGQ